MSGNFVARQLVCQIHVRHFQSTRVIPLSFTALDRGDFCRISGKAFRILEVDFNLWQPTMKIL